MRKMKIRILLVATLPFLVALSFDETPSDKNDFSLIVEGRGPFYSPGVDRSIRAATNDSGMMDFNGDGNADAVAGSPLMERTNLDQIGGAWVIWGGRKGLTKKNTQLLLSDFDRLGIRVQTGDFFAISFAAGDFNGDTITDLAVGASGYDGPAGGNSGAVLVYHGKKKGKPVPSNVFFGSRALDLLGQSVASGDFNNDGFDDLIAGAPGTTVGATSALLKMYSDVIPGAPRTSSSGKANAGSAKIYLGSVSGLQPGKDLSRERLKGPLTENAFFGLKVFTADVNSDGYSDAICYAQEANRSGSLNVIYGPGPAANAALSLGQVEDQFIRVKGNKPNRFGEAVDFYLFDNGEGRFVVGSPGANNDEGGVFVLKPCRSGLCPTKPKKRIISPLTKPGDEFGSVVKLGLGILVIGSPSADATIDSVVNSRTGATDLSVFVFEPTPVGRAVTAAVPDVPEFVYRSVGDKLATGRNSDDHLGLVVDLLPGKNNELILTAGVPGANVAGKNDAGAVYQERISFDESGNVVVKSAKTIHAGQLKGGGKEGDQFGLRILFSED